MAKLCLDCRFCVLEDEGYSNYTVENTIVYCAANLHPDAPFDNFYGDDPKHEFAETCEFFWEGGPGVRLDVEGEDEPDEHGKIILFMRDELEGRL